MNTIKIIIKSNLRNKETVNQIDIRYLPVENNYIEVWFSIQNVNLPDIYRSNNKIVILSHT